MKGSSTSEKLSTRVMALHNYKEKVFLFSRTNPVTKALSLRIRSAVLVFTGVQRAKSIKANGKTIIFMEKANLSIKLVTMKVALLED
jgi:hypothetical protein